VKRTSFSSIHEQSKSLRVSLVPRVRREQCGPRHGVRAPQPHYHARKRGRALSGSHPMEYAEMSVKHVAGLGYATKLGVGSEDLARDVRVGMERRLALFG